MRKKSLIAALLLAFSISLSAQPQLVAHRGGRFEADENTLPAFRTALDAGITGYELDVHITSDGGFVIMHDNSPKRTAGTEGLLEQMTLKEISAIRSLKGNPVPTLKQVVDLFNRHDGLYVEFEMKTTRKELYTPEILEKYVDGLYAEVYRAKPAGSTYVFTSFDTRSLLMMRQRHPEAEVMYITSGGGLDRMMGIANTIGTKRFACNRAKITQAEIAAAHKEGFIVSLWPNTTVEEVMLSWLLGADIVCTDIPRQVVSYIGEHRLPIKP